MALGRDRVQIDYGHYFSQMGITGGFPPIVKSNVGTAVMLIFYSGSRCHSGGALIVICSTYSSISGGSLGGEIHFQEGVPDPDMLRLTLVEKRISKSPAGAPQTSPNSVGWQVTPFDANQRWHFSIFPGGGRNRSMLPTCGNRPVPADFKRISKEIISERLFSIAHQTPSR
jgi:hypothetical protein